MSHLGPRRGVAARTLPTPRYARRNALTERRPSDGLFRREASRFKGRSRKERWGGLRIISVLAPVAPRLLRIVGSALSGERALRPLRSGDRFAPVTAVPANAAVPESGRIIDRRLWPTWAKSGHPSRVQAPG